MQIDCGEATDSGFVGFKRKKVLRFKVNIAKPIVAVKSLGCGHACGTGIDYNATCEKACRQKYQTESMSEVQSATSLVQDVYKTNVKVVETKPTSGPPSRQVSAPDDMIISVAGMSLYPASPEVAVKNVTAECTSGQIKKKNNCGKKIFFLVLYKYTIKIKILVKVLGSLGLSSWLSTALTLHRRRHRSFASSLLPLFC